MKLKASCLLLATYVHVGLLLMTVPYVEGPQGTSLARDECGKKGNAKEL